jgi:hypothetical protein
MLWTGLMITGIVLKSWTDFWRYDLRCKAVFIDLENINSLLNKSGFGYDNGLLHIDLDGNYYCIWEKIDTVSRQILILEYNSVFGLDRQITVPYDKCF